MAEENTVRLVLSVEEARKLLGLSRGLMYEAVRSGQLPSVRIGRRILIPRAALKRLLEEADIRHARSAQVESDSTGSSETSEGSLDGQQLRSRRGS